MVTMDLKQDYRFGGKLYRAGKGQTVPAELAEAITGKVPVAVDAGDSAKPTGKARA